MQVASGLRLELERANEATAAALERASGLETSQVAAERAAAERAVGADDMAEVRAAQAEAEAKAARAEAEARAERAERVEQAAEAALVAEAKADINKLE